jgi:hypothetical protein
MDMYKREALITRVYYASRNAPETCSKSGPPPLYKGIDPEDAELLETPEPAATMPTN